MLRNFLYRLGEYARENRNKLIKFALIIVGALLAGFIIYGIAESIERSRYYKSLDEFDKRIEQAEAKAKALEQQAGILKTALIAKYARLAELELQAKSADVKLQKTRTVYMPLEKIYEEIRNAPALPAAAISCADLCRQLSELGYPCEQSSK